MSTTASSSQTSPLPAPTAVPAAEGEAGLVISGLRAGVPGREVLRGVDITVRPGEVHAVMGPNGAGKSTLSHVLMGRPGYQLIEGSVLLNGYSLLELPTWQRARLGLFLALQYPIEVPGVRLSDVVAEGLAGWGRPASAERLAAEVHRVGLEQSMLDRAVNMDLSGGERKRSETMQLGVFQPSMALLDEIDSGLDVDGLRAVAGRVRAGVDEWGMGVLAVTHYRRLLDYLRPDVVHVLLDGKIVASGGIDLASELERTGYTGLS